VIPKRAFYTWVGPDMNWLRRLSVDSFKKQNPDWVVDEIRPQRDEYMGVEQNTDIARYGELADNGGLYFDTDILFLAPVPDDFMEKDVGISIDKSAFGYEANQRDVHPSVELQPGFNNLALMYSSADSEFFHYVHQRALDRLEWLRDDNVSLRGELYQAFGTTLLNREFFGKTQPDIEARFGIEIDNIPLDVVLPIRWNKSYQLFNGTPFVVPDNTIGVHWYGGCVDAKRYCSQFALDTYKRRPCYLTDVIDEVLK